MKMAKQSLLNLLIKGTLTKLGRILDFLTGRTWQPSSTLATSVVIEKIKKLMEAEIKKEANGKFVPHKIWLKAQWNMFDLETEEKVEMLKNEILTAIVDYINDNRYYTYAPLNLEIKSDYFVEGVVLRVGFDEIQGEKAEIRINLDDKLAKQTSISEKVVSSDSTGNSTAEFIAETAKVIAEYDLGGEKKISEIELKKNSRINIGRADSNDLIIKDATVSKIHASLFLNKDGQLMISDLGSSNGTFVNGEQIPYGKAYLVSGSDEIRFGSVRVNFYCHIVETSKESKTVVSSESSDFTAESKTIALEDNLQSVEENRKSVLATISFEGKAGADLGTKADLNNLSDNDDSKTFIDSKKVKYERQK